MQKQLDVCLASSLFSHCSQKEPNTLVQILTILVEELVDGRLLRVEEQRRHVVVGFIGAEKLPDG